MGLIPKLEALASVTPQVFAKFGLRSDFGESKSEAADVFRCAGACHGRSKLASASSLVPFNNGDVLRVADHYSYLGFDVDASARIACEVAGRNHCGQTARAKLVKATAKLKSVRRATKVRLVNPLVRTRLTLNVQVWGPLAENGS